MRGDREFTTIKGKKGAPPPRISLHQPKPASKDIIFDPKGVRDREDLHKANKKDTKKVAKRDHDDPGDHEFR